MPFPDGWDTHAAEAISGRHEPEGTTAAQGLSVNSCIGQQPRHEPGPTCIIPDVARVAPA